MEAIREYLSNMFMNLPETPQVLRAKAELMEMMEDEYEELIAEGMSEKEAVGTVISEFGNLDELAEELGIGDFMKKRRGTAGEKEPSCRPQMGAGRSEEIRCFCKNTCQVYCPWRYVLHLGTVFGVGFRWRNQSGISRNAGRKSAGKYGNVSACRCGGRTVCAGFYKDKRIRKSQPVHNCTG